MATAARARRMGSDAGPDAGVRERIAARGPWALAAGSAGRGLHACDRGVSRSVRGAANRAPARAALRRGRRRGRRAGRRAPGRPERRRLRLCQACPARARALPAGGRAARVRAAGAASPGHQMTNPRVLVVHNRYRIHGGEERAVDLQVAALRRAAVPYQTFFAESAEAGKVRAARSLMRGGEEPGELVAAVRNMDAQVVHFHNIHPLLGSRALAAAKDVGARVVMHLHNFRLFCAIGVCFRLGEPCFRCHGRWTAPGVALNCRRSLPEAAAYAYALSAHQDEVFESVDRFVTPSSYAAGQLEKLGLPAGRTDVVPHYIPAAALADRSLADRGQFALAFGRLSAEKGFDCAIDAAAIAGIP